MISVCKILHLLIIYLFLLINPVISSDSRPNIIFVLTDDQGWDDIGFNKNILIDTPNLDRFARDGIQMQNFYVNPVCSPSRAAFLTGRYPQRTKVHHVGNWMATDEVTIAKYLYDSGYATGLFGKWHLGDNCPLRPSDKGFEKSVRHLDGQFSRPWNKSEYFDPIVFENDIEKQYKGIYCNDLWFDKAESFMEDNITKNRPFFCYISTNLPHGPNQVPDDLIDKYMKKNLGGGFARYYGMIEHVDNRFGQLIDKLIKWGVYDNTLIFFTSDNGNAFRSPGIILKTLRGKKGDVYDGGVRVPAVWGGGLIKESGKLKEITAHVDFMPTVLEVCEVALPSDKKIDGKSLWPLLQNDSQEWSQRLVFIRHGFPEEKDLPESYEFSAVRGQRFKMVQQRGWDNTHIGDPEKPEFELYDMDKDPGEYYNISAMHPSIVENYRRAFDLWWQDIRSERSDKQFVDPRERLHIGSIENPFDFRNWDERIRVTILDEGPYNITIRPILIPTWRQSKAYQEEYISKGNGYLRFSVGDTMIEKKVKPNDKEWIINNIKLPIGDHILFKHVAVDTDIEKVTKYNWNDKKFAVRPVQLLISKQ